MTDGTIVFSVPQEDLDATGRVILEAERWCKIFYADGPWRPRGKWIDEGFYADGHGAHAFRCSECGGHIIEYDEDPFCRWCGADMRQREEEQDE